jgi:hypothetical protein
VVPELKSAPVSPRGGAGVGGDGESAAQLAELRACTTALLGAVEQLVKALPEATIATMPDEIDALAAVCRKTQQCVDHLGAARSQTPPPEHSSLGLSASTSRVPDDPTRRVLFTDDSGTARRSIGSATAASKKAFASSNLVIGTPVVVAPGSPQLSASPSRGRRSSTTCRRQRHHAERSRAASAIFCSSSRRRKGVEPWRSRRLACRCGSWSSRRSTFPSLCCAAASGSPRWRCRRTCCCWATSTSRRCRRCAT